MKYVIVGPSKYHYTKSIAAAISQIGHDVTVFYYEDFYEACTYLQRKMYKMGYHSLETKWNDKRENELKKVCISVSDYGKLEYSLIVVSNIELGDNVFLEIPDCEKIICMWDTVKICKKSFLSKLRYFQQVYVFEKNDRVLLKHIGIQSDYLPLGYNADVFTPKGVNKDIDICFIGMPDDERLHTVEHVARYAVEKNIKMYICGEWYDKRHLWRKFIYKNKHPELYRFIDNKMIDAREAANIYSRSKICLNINRKVHTSINPRTFEILATQSCMFMNKGVDVAGILTPGVDYIEYVDDNDLLVKIDHILNNDSERIKVSRSGYSKIVGKYSIQQTYAEIL